MVSFLDRPMVKVQVGYKVLERGGVEGRKGGLERNKEQEEKEKEKKEKGKKENGMGVNWRSSRRRKGQKPVKGKSSECRPRRWWV